MSLKGSIHSRPLERAGVEILDIDLRHPVSQDQLDELMALFDKHYMLVFRGQGIEAEDQVRILSAFGPVCDYFGNGRYDMLVSNVEEAGARLGEKYLPFHRDFDFIADTPPVLSLYGLELEGPAIPTQYIDCVRAARLLPPRLRAKLEGRSIVNKDYSITFGAEGGAPYTRIGERWETTEYLSKSWPILRPHPRTGELLIAATEMETSHVEGLSPRDSTALLGELFDYLYTQEHIQVHPWQLGDFVIWDNIAMQHGRRDTSGFADYARRTLRRAIVSEKGYRELLAGAEHYRPELAAM